MPSGPPTVVLATTNGRGMGHLSRQMALALASLGGMDPVIFSMSSAVAVAGQFDMRAEFAPGPLRGQVPRRYWDFYLAERIMALIQEVNASAFVFDGVYPYDGVLRALRRLPDVPFIWSRRGMWKPGAGARALRYRRLFAAVIEPGDLASSGDAGRTAELDDARRVGPVTLAGLVRPLGRAAAREALGLDPDRPAVLITLGSTRRSDLYAAYGRTVERFAAEGWQVAVTSSLIAGDGHGTRRPGEPVMISVYPLVKYLSAFDAAVTASGYNVVHELLLSAVPTLLVPNDASVDDQDTRARVVAGQNLALAADPERPTEFEAALDRLLDERVRGRLRDACRDLPPPTGATEAARAVIGLAAGGRVETAERVEWGALNAQRLARRTLGRALPDSVATRMGRTGLLRGAPLSLSPQLLPAPDPARPTTGLRLPPVDPQHLVVTDALLPGLFEKRRVEHLLPGASDAYVAERARIAAEHYRLRPTAAPVGERAQAWARLGWAAGSDEDRPEV
ncbi:glycosyltransferase [Spongisporangium articulatum]|uniref:Glycosyltransferase n=1 Tax=Spongisporangium articulatum TaxID=3362603 RepID=A0ABW8APX7_9ACTN